MKRLMVPVGFASFIVLSLGLVLPVHGQFGGQKKGGPQQGGGMPCSKMQGGGGSQTPFNQASSTMRPFGQNIGMQNPYAQTNSMQNPYAQNSYMQNPYSQYTGMQYPYAQNSAMQYPYMQSSGTQYPYTQNTAGYATTQYGVQNPLIQTSGNTGQFDAAQLQYLMQLMQYQAGTTPTQSGVQTVAQPTTNAQRIQQRRAAAQSTNVQLLRTFAK